MKVIENPHTLFLYVLILCFGTINCYTEVECLENVLVKLKELRNHAQTFKTEVAFDPFNHSTIVDKFFTYPNGFLGYTLGDDVLGMSKDGVLYSLASTVNGNRQVTQAEQTGEGFYSLIKPDGRTIKNFNPISGLNSNDPTELKISTLYKSAKTFYKNLKHNKKNQFTKNTTLFEVKDNVLSYEENNALKIVEKLKNGKITGTFECKFVFPDGWGTTSDNYSIAPNSNEVVIVDHRVRKIL